ncbi:cytochrome P450 98A3 [Coprinopsis sp. MPI-PUGE-AT-0042]|nr:cytochrome P450 98A3 [Coprinopsis sp. MPI-PUGE-AT-0042]
MLLELLSEPLNACMAASFIISAYLFQATRTKKSSCLPLPPGPKGFPLIGNLLDIPQDKPWKTYSKWAKEYGDVVYFHTLGQNFVVLNSLAAANDLLTLRAPVYSDRTESPVIDILGLQWTIVLKQYGSEWRDYRRAFHRFFNAAQVHQFRPIVMKAVPKLLDHLLSTPQSFREALHEFFGLVIVRAAYGSEDGHYNRNLIHAAAAFNEEAVNSVRPGRYLVSIVHILRYVPAWFPGARWKRTLQSVACLGEKVIEEPFSSAKERLEAGIQHDQGLNVATQLIADLPPSGSLHYKYEENMAKHVSSICYLAGSETTDSSALALIYALATNPEVQQKAQQELDRVVGPARLPDFGDFDQLPYIQAVIKEVGRWHSTTPLCVPHVSKQEDEYEGYRILAKSIILPNVWAIMHDPIYFKDPTRFELERYLKDGKINLEVLDPEAAAFGFGRRICPGRHFSTQALTMMVASVLSCFNIKPPKDEKGQDIIMGPMDMSSEIISVPAPFDCSLIPRSDQHVQLIKSVVDAA